MAVSISYSTKSAYVAFSGASSTAFTGLPTGVPVIIVVVNGYGTSCTLGSFQLATDGLSPTASTGPVTVSAGRQVWFLYFSSITTANQNLTFTHSGSYAEGLAYAFTVTGHDTAGPFGTTSSDTTPTTLNFTFDTTGDALICQFFGTTGGSATFGEGTWSNGIGDVGITYWSSNLTAGTKSISVSPITPDAAAMVEIKAGGGPVTVAASGSALTPAAGTAASLFSIGL